MTKNLLLIKRKNNMKYYELTKEEEEILSAIENDK